uniref:Uncharacterized protein n=1 Tax=Magallana gigas TaxID=29159 RepID=K1RF12_MAGGI
MNIDMTCEDCDEFICSQCAKTDHKDHNWKTIPTAGSQRRRGLKKTLGKVKEQDVKELDKMIQQAAKQMEDNQNCFESELYKLRKHFDMIVSKLDEIKKNYENTLREKLESKNTSVSEGRLNLEENKKQIMDVVEFLEEKHSTMSDFSLIDNLRDLKTLLSIRDSANMIFGYPLRYKQNSIREELLESMMGEVVDLNEITVTEADSFHIENKPIEVLEGIDETMFVSMQAGDIKIRNKISHLNVNVSTKANDACLTDTGDVFFTEFTNKSINYFSMYKYNSASLSFSTAPSIPYGICQATLDKELALLVTLKDDESERYQLNSRSRRLVRHVTLTGDIIREYEYQEDGQTRLFTLPVRVRQNGNTDICVINKTNESSSELVILSSSGCLKVVYRGHTVVENCVFSDIACDLRSNIILSDMKNGHIHLLGSDGGFVKFLLTQDEIRHPSSMSLSNSTLWIGNNEGLVKKFVSSNMKQPRNFPILRLVFLKQKISYHDFKKIGL